MEQDLPLGVRFSIISRCFKHELDERIRSFGLTCVQFGVLNELARLERSGAAEINQRDLEQLVHVTHPTMTEIIKRLEKGGFILCRRSEHDRRSKCICSTELTRKLFHELKAADSAVFARLCRGLDERQMADLIGITDVILSNAFSLEGDDCC